jgi:hypothetical protein
MRCRKSSSWEKYTEDLKRTLKDAIAKEYGKGIFKNVIRNYFGLHIYPMNPSAGLLNLVSRSL